MLNITGYQISRRFHSRLVKFPVIIIDFYIKFFAFNSNSGYYNVIY